MVTVDRLQTLSQAARPRIEACLNSDFINRNIATRLRESHDIPAELVVGSLCQSPGRREAHTFIRVPAAVVPEVTEPVIIDGAIEQFSDSRHGEVRVVLGPRRDLPRVAVLTAGDEYYEYYSESSV